MNLIKRKIFFLAVVTIAAAMFTEEVKAGGWPVRRKKLVVSASVNYFSATNIWDQSGKVKSYDNNGKFTSSGLFVYGEYGISRRLTAVGSLPFLMNNYHDDNGSIKSTGLGDAELGLRYYLFNIGFKYYFGLQGSAVLPLYKNSASTNLGYQDIGGDLKLAGSGSIKVDSLRSFYFNLEGGVRQYFASEGPLQVRGAFTVGYNLDRQNQVSAGITGIRSISNDKSFSNISLAQIKDFSYLQVSLSYGYIFSRRLSVFGGVNQSVIGRNTGIGTNLFLSCATRF